MIKRLLKYISALFVLTIIVTTSCKKYPDGPVISLHTKLHRVVGEWTVEFFSINGFDSSTYLNNQPLSGTYSFTKGKDGHPNEFAYNSNRTTDTSRYFSASGNWDFKNHKNQIDIETNHISHPWRHFTLGIFNENQKTLWEIQRLTEKEMWLKGTYSDGREYYFKLKHKDY